MKRLFRRNDLEWSEKASSIAIEVEDAVEPIFTKYLEKGYSVRELGLIVLQSCLTVQSRKAMDGRLKLMF